MKIAHLTTVDLSLRYLILPQLEAAAEAGEAYGMSAPGPYVAEIEALGIVHVPLNASTRGMSLLSDLRAMTQFWRAVRDVRPDILHTHNPKPGVYGRILGRLAGVPIVVNTVHGLYATPDSKLVTRIIVYSLAAIASRFSDAELIQNEEDLELLKRTHITSPTKLRLLGNGVDLVRFTPTKRLASRTAERHRLGIDEDEVAIGMVGRLVTEKGIAELIEAAQIVGPRARFLVAGPNDPDKDDSVSAVLLDRGRRAGVEFIGMREDIDLFYSALDMFVLPSHREGFPRAAMEAAASGLPLVLTDIRGCRQVVKHGENGLLVPRRDGPALASAIEELIADPERRATMGEASARRAKAEFDEERVVSIVMGTYRDVASKKGLAWKFPPAGEAGVTIRDAQPADARVVAALHHELIGTGFLASLGPSFLEVLYRALIRSRSGVVLVAESGSIVAGFVAGTTDTGSFYREFIRRNAVSAVIRMAPRLFYPSTWRRVWETFRYGSGGAHDVAAELLSMAVAPVIQGRGVAGRLVQGLFGVMSTRGVDAVKVVVGSANAAAISLYRSSGFGEEAPLEVHAGEKSLELIWRS